MSDVRPLFRPLLSGFHKNKTSKAAQASPSILYYYKKTTVTYFFRKIILAKINIMATFGLDLHVVLEQVYYIVFAGINFICCYL